jgi:nitroreductase
MNVSESVLARRSIRRFKNKPVAYEVLKKCIDAARLAPSGRNQQVVEYLVVNDPVILPVVFENIGGSAKLPPEKGGPRPDQSPKAYTIVLVNKALEGDESRRRVTLYDIGMAAQNIMLMAVEQGLGSCPILMFNQDGLRKALAVPPEYDIALVIIMGFPDENPVADVATTSTDIFVDDKGVRHVPKRKLADILHHNKFA